jgi:hypothetical protein
MTAIPFQTFHIVSERFIVCLFEAPAAGPIARTLPLPDRFTLLRLDLCFSNSSRACAPSFPSQRCAISSDIGCAARRASSCLGLVAVRVSCFSSCLLFSSHCAVDPGTEVYNFIKVKFEEADANGNGVLDLDELTVIIKDVFEEVTHLHESTDACCADDCCADTCCADESRCIAALMHAALMRAILA